LVERMATGVRAALRTASVREALAKLALEPADESGPQLARRITGEISGWREVSRVFGFHIDD
ncbi:MAG: hypothetical protein ACXWJM_04970, partial [Ramlibacter sp.]